MLPLVSAVGANLIANGLTNGLGAASVPSAPAVAPAAQLGYTLQPSASLLPDYGYSLANELQPQAQQSAIMLPLATTMPGLVNLGGAAETPAAAMPAKKCDTCSGPAVSSYAGQLSGPMMWAGIGALAGWMSGSGVIKGAAIGFVAALALDAAILGAK